jgi:hypothetical protein
MYTQAEFTHRDEPYLVRAVVTVPKGGSEPRVLRYIEFWDSYHEVWATLGEEDEALYLAAEVALLDAYSPAQEAAYGDWMVP